MKNSFNKILTITATNAGGINFIFFKTSTLFHKIKIANEIKAIITEPN